MCTSYSAGVGEEELKALRRAAFSARQHVERVAAVLWDGHYDGATAPSLEQSTSPRPGPGGTGDPSKGEPHTRRGPENWR